MNINFVFLSIFGILAGLTGHATSTTTTGTTVPATSNSTVDTSTPAVSTDASSPSAGGGSSATTDSAATATGSTVVQSTLTVSTDASSPSASGGSSSSSSDSSSGTTAESNTASDMSGTTTADSASTAKVDSCYNLTHSCNQTTNVSLCFDDYRKNHTSDTCPRNGKYCVVKGIVKDNTTFLEAACVETSCDYNDYTTDSEGHVTLNCCSANLCNDENLLYAGSPSLRGVLPLVLLAAAAAVAVGGGGGASTAGTNIVV